MKIKTAKWLGGGVLLIALISVVLMIKNEWETVFAWWLATILLLPGLLLALRSEFVSLKVICLIAFITQFVTLPIFFLARDDFKWGYVNSFGFTAGECLPILLKVGAFMVILVLCFHFLSRLPFFSVWYRKTGSVAQHLQRSRFTDELLKPSSHPWNYVVLIVLVIAAVTPLNLWMFSEGIGLTGVESTELPYRLSGILHYLAHFLIPMLLGYLYSKTRHGHSLTLLLLGYGLILGLSSVSRSAMVLVMLPVLFIAWLEGRRLTLLVALIGVGIAYSLISQARNFVYVAVGNNSGANTDVGVFDILGSVVSKTEWLEPALYLEFLGILGRVEGFDNLVMAHYYDPNAVDSAFSFILRMIWQPLAPIDIDAHHIQWQGYAPLEGFYNGGGLLSNMVIASNDNLIWIAPVALVVAVILLTLERSIQHLAKKYDWTPAIEMFSIGMITTVFFLNSGGSVTFMFPFLAAMIFSWLPRASVRHFFSLKPKHSASRRAKEWSK